MPQHWVRARDALAAPLQPAATAAKQKAEEAYRKVGRLQPPLLHSPRSGPPP